jgi:hypothetical protein
MRPVLLKTFFNKKSRCKKLHAAALLEDGIDNLHPSEKDGLGLYKIRSPFNRGIWKMWKKRFHYTMH